MVDLNAIGMKFALISEQENSQPPKKKRKGILGEIFGELDLKSEEGKKLIEMKSRNNHYVQIVSH